MDELELYQFPIKFIHPALMYHQEAVDKIMHWFIVHCNYAHAVKVIGHRFMMKRGEIIDLQHHLRNEKQQIKNEMGLNFSVIPIPNQIYSRIYIEIRQHPTLNYNDRFKVIVVSSDETDEVNQLIKKARNELEKETKGKNSLSEETLCCLYIRDDPDNPALTNYPITVYFKDGTTYKNKMCRDCLCNTLRVNTESYYADGKIDQNSLENLMIKPAVIPSVSK